MPLMPTGPQDAADPQAAIEHLKEAIKQAQAALVSEPNDADSQALADIVKQLYAIIAKRQKETQAAMGGPAMPALQRALMSQGPGGQ